MHSAHHPREKSPAALLAAEASSKSEAAVRVGNRLEAKLALPAGVRFQAHALELLNLGVALGIHVTRRLMHRQWCVPVHLDHGRCGFVPLLHWRRRPISLLHRRRGAIPLLRWGSGPVSLLHWRRGAVSLLRWGSGPGRPVSLSLFCTG